MFIRQAAFGGKERLLKGNLHTHTTRSDGRGSPETTIRHFEALGYDFLALTDHNYYNYENFVPGSELLIMPAMELDTHIEEPGIHCVHVVSLGPDKEDGNGFEQDQRFRYPVINEISEAQGMIDDVIAAGNVPVYCHPEWSGTPAWEIETLHGFGLMEVWNSGNVQFYDVDSNTSCWDELLYHGRKIYGLASDDGHNVHFDCHGFIRVRAEKNRRSILNALQNGAFYASTGPEIYDFYVEDGQAVVICSPVSRIRFRYFHYPYHCVYGFDMTAAQMAVRPGTNYIRAEVIDDKGRRAWTNPIFLDQENH